jgi:hypothetical protein
MQSVAMQSVVILFVVVLDVMAPFWNFPFDPLKKNTRPSPMLSSFNNSKHNGNRDTSNGNSGFNISNTKNNNDYSK